MDGTYHEVIFETCMRGTQVLEQESGCYQSSNMSTSFSKMRVDLAAQVGLH